MSLLRDKVVDNPVEEEDKTPAVLPSRPGLFHERKDELANITLQDNRSGSHIISRKAINSSVGEFFFSFLVYIFNSVILVFTINANPYLMLSYDVSLTAVANFFRYLMRMLLHLQILRKLIWALGRQKYHHQC